MNLKNFREEQQRKLIADRPLYVEAKQETSELGKARVLNRLIDILQHSESSTSPEQANYLLGRGREAMHRYLEARAIVTNYEKLRDDVEKNAGESKA